MRLPKPIYEAIPYIYIISAVLTILLVDSIISFFSGFFFGYAGWMVWRTRKDYRQFNVLRNNQMPGNPVEMSKDDPAEM